MYHGCYKISYNNDADDIYTTFRHRSYRRTIRIEVAAHLRGTELPGSVNGFNN